MRLSLECSRLDWWNIEQELTPEQYMTWTAYDLLEGVGSVRDDLRMAHQTSAIAAINGVEISPAEMLYDIDTQDERNEQEEELDMLSVVSSAFGVPMPPRLNHGK